MELFEKDIIDDIKHYLMFDLTSCLSDDFSSGNKFLWGESMIEYSKLLDSPINFYKIGFVKINCREASVTVFPDGAFIAQNIGLTFVVYHFNNDEDELQDEGFCNVSLEGHYFWPEKKLTYIKPVHFLWEDEPFCTDQKWIEYQKRYCLEDALIVDVSSKFDLTFREAREWVKENKIPDIAQDKIDIYNNVYRQRNEIAKKMFCNRA